MKQHSRCEVHSLFLSHRDFGKCSIIVLVWLISTGGLCKSKLAKQRLHGWWYSASMPGPCFLTYPKCKWLWLCFLIPNRLLVLAVHGVMMGVNCLKMLFSWRAHIQFSKKFHCDLFHFCVPPQIYPYKRPIYYYMRYYILLYGIYCSLKFLYLLAYLVVCYLFPSTRMQVLEAWGLCVSCSQLYFTSQHLHLVTLTPLNEYFMGE